jgi:hypothetical protein
MAAHMLSVGSLFALRFQKCDHIEEKSVLKTVEDHTTLGEVFESEHGELPKNYNIGGRQSQKSILLCFGSRSSPKTFDNLSVLSCMLYSQE